MSKTAKYVDDGGNAYTITVPDWVDGIDNAKTGLAAVSDPPDPALPKRFQVRAVYAKSAAGLRRRIPCNTTGTLYDTTASQDVTIATVAYDTTGRVGERMTFTSFPSIS